MKSAIPIKNIIFCPKCGTLSPTKDLHILDKPNEIPAELLKDNDFEKVIGVGSFGPVFKCLDIHSKKCKAMKIIFDIDDNFFFDLDFMKKMNHHFLIKYYKYELKKEEGWAYVSTELADMNLNEAIQTNFFDTEEKKVKVFMEICEAVAYLHTSLNPPKIHRNLKPHNILIIDGEARITDLEIINPRYKDFKTEIYMPPELLSRKGSSFITNEKHDIWTLGIILHEIFTGKNPFKYDDFWNANICSCKYRIDYQYISENSIIDKILKGCFIQDPHQRMKINEILNNLINYHQKASFLQETEGEEKKIDVPFKKQSKHKNLNEIIAHLKNDRNYKIAFNSVEYYHRSGILTYFHEDNIPKEINQADIKMFSSFDGLVLSELELGTCDIEILENLCNSISSNTCIKVLIIQNDDTVMTGNLKNIKKLKNAISSNKSIEFLMFNNIDLGNANFENLEDICCSISSSETIKRLGFYNNNIGSGNLKNIELISNCILSMKNLDWLAFQNNQLEHGKLKNIELISKSISKSNSITTLGLYNNSFGDGEIENIKLILNSISSNESIFWVGLQRINLGNGKEENLKIILNFISSNKNLRYLGLNNNNLGIADIKIVEQIFNAISSNKNITHLFLQQNKLGNGNIENVELIFKSISANKNLKRLWLLSELNCWTKGSPNHTIMNETKKRRNSVNWN